MLATERRGALAPSAEITVILSTADSGAEAASTTSGRTPTSRSSTAASPHRSWYRRVDVRGDPQLLRAR